MSLPRVYADFNALERGDDQAAARMALTGYGTLMSLAQQNLRLAEGMALLLYEPDDIECEATVHFESGRVDPAGHVGAWVAWLDPRCIRDCKLSSKELKAHPCIICGTDFMAQTHALGRNYREVCASCGASVMEPMAPPKNAAKPIF
jgi:hypothetical protein